MVEIDRGGSKTAYFGADERAEGGETDTTDTVEIAFFVFGVGCRIGVCILKNFAAAVENTDTARVGTITTDEHDLDDATHDAVVPSCPFRTSPSSVKIGDDVVDYLDVAVRLVMIYECVEFYVIVIEEEFGITVDTGFELPSEAHEILGVVTTIIFAFKLCSQLERWQKDILKILARGLRATVESLRCVARASGRGLRASVAGLRCVARTSAIIVLASVFLLWEIGKIIVYAARSFMARMSRWWQTARRDSNNDDHNDEELTAEPVPSPILISEFPSATETSDNTTPETRPPPEGTPNIDTDHVARRDRSCRSPTNIILPHTAPRTPPQQQGGAGSIANGDDGNRRSASESLKETKNEGNATDTTIVPVNGPRGGGDKHSVPLSPASAPKVDIFPDGWSQARPAADGGRSHAPASIARDVKSRKINTPPGHRLASRPPVDQGIKIHCCTVDPLTRKEMWVHAQYFEDIHGEAVPGVFTYLPVTLLRPIFSELSTDRGRKWYVQPGGKMGRKEWIEEDGRVIWEVPQARTFGKVCAEPDEKCDVCRRKDRQCSWTPDRLECLCDYCADAPRRHLYGYGRARDLGFSWTRACGCLG